MGIIYLPKKYFKTLTLKHFKFLQKYKKKECMGRKILTSEIKVMSRVLDEMFRIFPEI